MVGPGTALCSPGWSQGAAPGKPQVPVSLSAGSGSTDLGALETPERELSSRKPTVSESFEGNVEKNRKRY